MKLHGRLAFAAVVMVAAVGALLFPMAPVLADGTPARVRGSVVSLDGPKLVVHAKDGKDVSISLADNFAALAVVKSSMADIKQGTFIGTATVTQPDSTLRSVEVVVFPDNLRGTAEGHYPWDLGPSSMMTNGNVAAVSAAPGASVNTAMTDGTVSASASQNGVKRLTVTYNGGQQLIVVPPTAPIVDLLPSAESDLSKGAYVFVDAAKDGRSLTAGLVAAGAGRLKPPF